MRQFPGRTLDELDGIDWFRLRRAKQAEIVEEAEKVNQLYKDKRIDADKIPTSVWETIRDNQRILESADETPPERSDGAVRGV